MVRIDPFEDGNSFLERDSAITERAKGKSQGAGDKAGATPVRRKRRRRRQRSA